VLGVFGVVGVRVIIPYLLLMRFCCVITNNSNAALLAIKLCYNRANFLMR